MTEEERATEAFRDARPAEPGETIKMACSQRQLEVGEMYGPDTPSVGGSTGRVAYVQPGEVVHVKEYHYTYRGVDLRQFGNRVPEGCA